ncbi:ribonuclease P protein component [Candidatus Wolfebacteria bacterium CG02_land_8_20_14_3_00_37_12]|uniref:Ribonuclease P protein component n=2 Tax=Candidatus Wolfeibacteriota TaxID=1752735 RepID=A0A2M7Q8A5_9BACT|nr:MAG: ribonuclease P protein component [Candidatus Wolfebacteria bacterium CG02_land_8_20_14_3_00_37_12]PIY59613.1 MAG: ribonuclease P protein component [Candidatus Wolfebacteria bacterium CG_4_10_14_0_8_um_filter_37_11]
MLAKKYRLQIQNWLKNKNKRIISRRSDFFIIRMSANDLFFSRFGVIISAKVSKSAVKRNRIKRIIYDFIRLNKFNEIKGNDVAITVLPAIAKLDKNEIEKELKNVITFQHIFI